MPAVPHTRHPCCPLSRSCPGRYFPWEHKGHPERARLPPLPAWHCATGHAGETGAFPVRTREAFAEKAVGFFFLREFVADSFSFPGGCQEAHSQIHSPAPTAGAGLDQGSVPHSALSDPLLPSGSFAHKKVQGGTEPDLMLLIRGLQVKVCSLRNKRQLSWSQSKSSVTGVCWVERIIHFKVPSEAVFPYE